MDRELNPSSPTKSPAFTGKSLDLFALLDQPHIKS